MGQQCSKCIQGDELEKEIQLSKSLNLFSYLQGHRNKSGRQQKIQQGSIKKEIKNENEQLPKQDLTNGKIVALEVNEKPEEESKQEISEINLDLSLVKEQEDQENQQVEKEEQVHKESNQEKEEEEDQNQISSIHPQEDQQDLNSNENDETLVQIHEKYIDGSSFVGKLKGDSINGHGIYTTKDGRKYEGEWRDNKKHGLGTDVYPSGNVYIGEFLDGKMHGYGKFTWNQENNRTIYEGEWAQGKMDGLARLTKNQETEYRVYHFGKKVKSYGQDIDNNWLKIQTKFEAKHPGL